MSDDVFDLLQDRLGGLPEARFVKVFALLDQLPSKEAAAQAIYERARPRLKRVRPPRRMTLQRLFCLPLEDLLVDARRDTDIIDGRILRRAMIAAWTYVSHQPGVNLAEMAVSLRKARGAGTDAENLVGRDLWRLGTEILGEALGVPGAMLPDGSPLFGPRDAWREDVSQVLRVLSMGDAIQSLKAALPSAPIRAIDDEIAHAIRRSVVANARGDVTRAYGILTVMLARVSPPALLLDRIAGLDLGVTVAGRAELMRWLSAPLASDLFERSASLAESREGGSLARASTLREFANALTSAEGAMGKGHGDPQLRASLGAFRAEITTGLDETLVEARGALGRDSLAASADIKSRTEAEHALQALRTCATVAGKFGRASAFETALQEVTSDARGDIEALVRELPAIVRDGGAAQARERVYRAVRLVELSSNPQDADALRRLAFDAMKSLGL